MVKLSTLKMIIICFVALLSMSWAQSSDIEMKFRLDDFGALWADGDHLGNFSDHRIQNVVTFDSNTQVVAMLLWDVYGVNAGFMGSLSSGMVSNGEADSPWRCTSDDQAGDDWKMPDFDDSDWPIATEVGSNGDSPWGTLNHVDSNAKWLWVPDWRNHRTIYCRVTLDLDTDDCAGVTCSGNGNCTDGDNSYTCTCDPLFTGNDCEDRQTFNCGDNNPCVPQVLVTTVFHYPSDASETQFVQCSEWGQCYVMPCAPGTVWNAEIGGCAHGGNHPQPTNSYSCALNSPCSEGDGIYPHAIPSKYILCYYSCYEFDCAPGLEWDQSNNVCNWPYLIGTGR